MSSRAVALPAAAAANSNKERSKQRKTCPPVSDLLMKFVSASKERNGLSLVALKKALQASGYDVVKNKIRIRSAIRRLVATASLVQTKGKGAAGSFKMNKNPPTPRKKVVKKKAAKKSRTKKVHRKSTKAVDAAMPVLQSKEKVKAKSAIKAKKPKSPRSRKRTITISIRTRSYAKK